MARTEIVTVGLNKGRFDPDIESALKLLRKDRTTLNVDLKSSNPNSASFVESIGKLNKGQTSFELKISTQQIDGASNSINQIQQRIDRLSTTKIKIQVDTSELKQANTDLQAFAATLNSIAKSVGASIGAARSSGGSRSSAGGGGGSEGAIRRLLDRQGIDISEFERELTRQGIPNASSIAAGVRASGAPPPPLDIARGLAEQKRAKALINQFVKESPVRESFTRFFGNAASTEALIRERADEFATRAGRPGLASDLVAAQIQANRIRPLAAVRNLTDPQTLVQVGIAGLRGGLPSVGAAAIGGAIAGPGGALVASAGAQAAQAIIEPFVAAFEQNKDRFKEAGLAFQRSILGISAVLNATSERIGPGGRISTNIASNLLATSREAEQIQLAARARLLPQGISGASEAALVSGTVTGLNQRGIRSSRPQVTAQISEIIGGIIQTQAPQLFGNEGRLLREIQDVLSGGPLASRTALSPFLRPAFSGLQRATSEEGVLQALQPLKGFATAARDSDNAVTALNKLSGALDNLNTTAGVTLLDTITPAIKELTKNLQDPATTAAFKTIGEGFGQITKLGFELGTTLTTVGRPLVSFVGNIAKLSAALGAGAKFLTGGGAAVDAEEAQRLNELDKIREQNVALFQAGVGRTSARQAFTNLLSQGGVSAEDLAEAQKATINTPRRAQVGINRALELLRSDRGKDLRSEFLLPTLDIALSNLDDVEKETVSGLESLGAGGKIQAQVFRRSEILPQRVKLITEKLAATIQSLEESISDDLENGFDKQIAILEAQKQALGTKDKGAISKANAQIAELQQQKEAVVAELNKASDFSLSQKAEPNTLLQAASSLLANTFNALATPVNILGGKNLIQKATSDEIFKGLSGVAGNTGVAFENIGKGFINTLNVLPPSVTEGINAIRGRFGQGNIITPNSLAFQGAEAEGTKLELAKRGVQIEQDIIQAQLSKRLGDPKTQKAFLDSEKAGADLVKASSEFALSRQKQAEQIDANAKIISTAFDPKTSAGATQIAARQKILSEQSLEQLIKAQKDIETSIAGVDIQAVGLQGQILSAGARRSPQLPFLIKQAEDRAFLLSQQREALGLSAEQNRFAIQSNLLTQAGSISAREQAPLLDLRARRDTLDLNTVAGRQQARALEAQELAAGVTAARRARGGIGLLAETALGQGVIDANFAKSLIRSADLGIQKAETEQRQGLNKAAIGVSEDRRIPLELTANLLKSKEAILDETTKRRELNQSLETSKLALANFSASLRDQLIGGESELVNAAKNAQSFGIAVPDVLANPENQKQVAAAEARAKLNSTLRKFGLAEVEQQVPGLGVVSQLGSGQFQIDLKNEESKLKESINKIAFEFERLPNAIALLVNAIETERLRLTQALGGASAPVANIPSVGITGAPSTGGTGFTLPSPEKILDTIEKRNAAEAISQITNGRPIFGGIPNAAIPDLSKVKPTGAGITLPSPERIVSEQERQAASQIVPALGTQVQQAIDPIQSAVKAIFDELKKQTGKMIDAPALTGAVSQGMADGLNKV